MIIQQNTDVVNVIVVVHHMSPCVNLPCVLLAVLLGYIGSSVMIRLSDTARHSAMYCLFGQEHIREGNLSGKSGASKFLRYSGKAVEWEFLEENIFPKLFQLLQKHICLLYQSNQAMLK